MLQATDTGHGPGACPNSAATVRKEEGDLEGGEGKELTMAREERRERWAADE